jgi:hypothetical protein
VYDIASKRILRSRNVIFSEEPHLASKPDVQYDLLSEIYLGYKPLGRQSEHPLSALYESDNQRLPHVTMVVEHYSEEEAAKASGPMSWLISFGDASAVTAQNGHA